MTPRIQLCCHRGVHALVTLYTSCTLGGTAKAVIDKPWAAFGQPTIKVLADGTLTRPCSG